MIAVASDRAAYTLKERIIKHLKERGEEVLDCGTYDADKPSDYPDFAVKACRAVLEKKCGSAILVCGTGIGMSICANKMKGIRCALCSDTFSARMTKLHNDANVLALGERVLGEGLALDIVDAFLNTSFSNDERHVKRIEKICKIESGEQ